MTYKITIEQRDLLLNEVFKEDREMFETGTLFKSIEELAEVVRNGKEVNTVWWVLETDDDTAGDIAELCQQYQKYAGFDKKSELNSVGKVLEDLITRLN